MDEAIAVLKQQGAIIVDPADIPSVVDKDPKNNFLLWNLCSGAERRARQGRELLDRLQVRHEARLQQVAGVARRGGAGEDADRAARVEHRAPEGAARSSTASRTSTSPTRWTSRRTSARYEADRAKDIRLGGTHGIDEVMKARAARRDPLPRRRAAPASPRKPGYPTVIVPFALVPNAPTPAFPAGFDAKPAPFGVSFTGMACSEPKLIELAYAFEQATKKRVPPPLFP